MISSTSPPEHNPRPVPVITRTRTSSRCGSSVRRSRRSAYTSSVSALSRSGRPSVTVATPSSRAKSKCCQFDVNPAEERKGLTRRPSLEGSEPGDGLAQDQLVDLGGPLVGQDGLEVVHVAD